MWHVANYLNVFYCVDKHGLDIELVAYLTSNVLTTKKTHDYHLVPSKFGKNWLFIFNFSKVKVNFNFFQLKPSNHSIFESSLLFHSFLKLREK